MGIQRDTTRGGMTTARVQATDQAQAHRDQAAADATAYLTRHGHADLLPVLGLLRPTEAAPEPAPAQPPAVGRRDRGPVRPDVVHDLTAGRRPIGSAVTPAELDAAIDQLDGRGWSAREIAERLATTARTVHRRRAARRTQAGDS